MLLTPGRILIIAAIVPAIILLIYVYKKDKLDRESPAFIARLVISGIVSTFLAMITERLGEGILGMYFKEDSLAYNAIMYFGIVAFSEEGFKYLMLKKRTWYSNQFRCQFDGVVYAVSVSLGFALWENIGYVTMYGMSTAIVRSVTAVPGHACFGVFMGAWYGLAKRLFNSRKFVRSKICRIMAVILPAIMHGTYDFTASLNEKKYTLIFVAFIALMFIICMIMVNDLSKNDKYISSHTNNNSGSGFYF